MLWDASDAYENNRYDLAIKQAMSKTGNDVPNAPPSSGPGGGSGTNSTAPGSSGGSGEPGAPNAPNVPSPGGSGHGKTCIVSEDQIVWLDKARTTYSSNGQLLPRDGVKILFTETRKVVNVLKSVVRYHLSTFRRTARSSISGAIVSDWQRLKLHRRNGL